MAGLVFLGQGVFKRLVAVSFLIILAGCTTLPAPPAQPGSPSALPAAELAPSTPAASRLADFIAKRFRQQAQTPVPEVEPEAPATTEVPVDEKYQLTGEAARELERGNASWYGGKFHGLRTASGENYDKYALTAAHRTLPFGTIVRVRSLTLGHEVDVRINDRGPFAPGRVIDVSQAAAEALGLMEAGVAEVSLSVDAALGKVISSRRRRR